MGPLDAMAGDAPAAAEGAADDAAAVRLVRSATAASRSSTVRRAAEACDDPWAASANRCSAGDSEPLDSTLGAPSVDGASASVAVGSAEARITSTRASMRSIEARAASTAATWEICEIRGAAVRLAVKAVGADDIAGVEAAGIEIGLGASSLGRTTASPDQIGDRSATPGRPEASTERMAPATTSAAAAAANGTEGDHMRAAARGPGSGSADGRIDGATVAITGGASTGIATWLHAVSPASRVRMNVPRVVSADARGVSSSP
jgi:hypothetical protein